MSRASRFLIPIGLIVLSPTAAMAQGNLPGFPKYTINNQTGAPLFFDVDGDGVDELLHANADHTIDIWEAGGVAFPGFPVPGGWHVWNMTPAVGDIDGDGDFEVITGANDQRVYAYHTDGTAVAGFPVYLGGEIPGGPCLADLDGDGDLEILVQPRGSGIYALQGDGSVMPGWPVPVSTNEGGSQTPAAADIDNDGVLEIVTTSQGIGSVLTVVHPDGSPQPGFPLIVTYTVGSPAMADLDRDGDLEIVATVGSNLHAWHHDAMPVTGFPVDCGNWSLYTSPAIGDLDRDGYLEIVFGSQNDSVYVVRSDGTFAPGWPSPPTTGSVHATPCLADLDFDGDLEILVAAPTSGSGYVYGWHHDGTVVDGFPWSRPSSFYGGLTLGDLDDDGGLDLAAAGRSGSALYAWMSPFDYDPTRIVHACYRRNRHNNATCGLHPLDGMLGVSVEAPVAASQGQTIEVIMRVENRSGSSATADVLLEMETPQGERVTLIEPTQVALDPGQEVEFPVDVFVDPTQPTGGFRILASLRDISGHVLHWDAALLTVLEGGLLGDLNCDGHVNAFDIDPFVLALTDPAAYNAAWPNCDIMNGDINGDGEVNAFDIDPFVELLTGG